MSIVGRTYLERGEPVTVLVQWRGPKKVERLDLPGLDLKPWTPRNVLIERADGSRVVRPFRGLRKVSPAVPVALAASPPALGDTKPPGSG